MSKLVIADEKMTAKLDAAGEPAMICTLDGRVLGYFTPAPPARLNLEPQISEEELQRREQEGGGRNLADILRDLEARQ